MRRGITKSGIGLLFCFVLLGMGMQKVRAQSPGGISFHCSDTAGCVPLQVSFSNTSALQPQSYNWDFGNGNTSVSPTPTNVYTNPGTYTIKLVLKDKSGKPFYAVSSVHVVNNPVASFNPDKTTVCQGAEVNFTNASTNATSWIWDFGDGNTLSANKASHVYSKPGTYTVKLLVANDYDCNNVMVKSNSITVYPLPAVAFVANITSTCDVSQIFTFTNNSKNAVSYAWDFGDGTTSTLANPQHTYGKIGKFTVKLTATSANGCVDVYTATDYINIKIPVQPKISCANTSACQGSIVRFSGSSQDSISEWVWSFGDGTTGTGKNPVHAYQDAGSYTVDLHTVNTTGCGQDIVIKNYIDVNGIVVAAFAKTAKGCDQVTVNFDNNSKNAKQYTWDFGDGTSSKAKLPVHSYAKSGIYDVTLHAFGGNGCEMVYTIPGAVKVFSLPTASFQASAHKSCPPLTVGFTDKSTDAASYSWDFGDKTYATDANPTHNYANEGTFKVKLVVTNTSGCTATYTDPAPFVLSNIHTTLGSSDPIKACAPFTTTFSDGTADNSAWLWDFADGNTSTEQNPSHTFKSQGVYNISLTTKNKGGCTQVIKTYQTIEVKNPPHPGFVTTKTTCPVGLQFHDTTTGGISYSWNFGDEEVGAGNNAAHSYIGSGIYTVTSSVLTANGCTVMDSQKVDYNAFFARISPDHADSVFPATIHFGSAAVGVKSFLWNFGDGTTSTLEKPVHVYTIPAIYKVTLTYSNGPCTTMDSVTLFAPKKAKIKDSLKASFYTAKRNGCAPFAANFTSTSTMAAHFLWDFGDGSTSKLANPSHIFKEPGSYNVKLVVQDSALHTDTLTRYSYVVINNPQANFKLHTIYKDNKASFTFEDNSSDAATWLWSFGDGNTSKEESPKHKYDGSATNYLVSLKVTANGGCSNSSSILINTDFVNPYVSFPAKACVGESTAFQTNLTGFSEYLWDFGDGASSEDATPKHTYQSAGANQVSLIAADKQGFTYEYFAPDSVQVDDPHAKFAVNGPKVNCDTLTVAFQNLCTGATSYLWDFGDGTTSTEAAPVHLYKTAGVFDATLTAYKNNCSNTYKLPKLITINKAEPAFTFTQDFYCMPVTASFKDKSVAPVSWHWDFGDGYTSDLQNPVHAYAAIPQKPVILSITDAKGCKGTSTDGGIGFIKARFDASVKNGCGPLGVSFTDASLFAQKWQWSFGDGTTSTQQNPVHVYKNDGLYTVKLTVKTVSGCIDSLTMINFIKVSRPVADFISPSKASCAPSFVSFTNQSKNAVSSFWDFGDSTYSDKSDPGHIYNLPGLYTVKLVVRNAEGCADSVAKVNYIRVLGPVTALKASASTGCPGTAISFTNLSKGAFKYNWNFGDGTVSTEKDPQHLYHNQGRYTASLITYDSFGCSSVAILSPGIRIFDSTPPPAPVILRVTVTSNASVNIAWTEGVDSQFKAFRVYRQDGDGNFIQIAELNNINTGCYEDKNLNTTKNAYTYKVQAVNICGYGNPLKDLAAHTTINLTAKPVLTNMLLSWTPYKGCEISGYSIMRQEPGAAPVMIAKVGVNELSYLDKEVYCPVPQSYRVMANDICGNAIASYSDTAVGILNIDFSKQKVDIVRSTVAGDNVILTEWATPVILGDKVTGYDILRSTDNANFAKIATVENMVTSYLDHDVETNTQNYFYKIIPKNACGQQAEAGLPGSSILLETSARGGDIEIKWTGYNGWDTGVGYYVIEKTDANGNWQFFQKVDGNKTSIGDQR